MHPITATKSLAATKTAAAVLAAALALVINVPHLVNKSAVAALVLIVLDTATGYVCAAFDSAWSSRMMRLKLVAKSSQYVLLLGSSACAAILAGDWSFVVAGWWAVIAIEAHSILENLIKWQAFGVDLGPAAPLLQRLSGFFAAGQIQTRTTVGPVTVEQTTATVQETKITVPIAPKSPPTAANDSRPENSRSENDSRSETVADTHVTDADAHKDTIP